VHKKLRKVYPSRVVDTRRNSYVLYVARLGKEFSHRRGHRPLRRGPLGDLGIGARIM
jgi:hypothetical protein